MDLVRRVRALRELRGPRELLLLAQMTAFAAAVPALLRLPLPRLAAFVTRKPRARRAPAEEVERLERLIALAPRIAHPLVRGGCLTRGLTLFWFLRRSGLDVELRFGLDVERGDAADGHCWIALDDEPFLEPRDPRARFFELYRLPLAAAA
jgi:hypothetical protein